MRDTQQRKRNSRIQIKESFKVFDVFWLCSASAGTPCTEMYHTNVKNNNTLVLGSSLVSQELHFQSIVTLVFKQLNTTSE